MSRNAHRTLALLCGAAVCAGAAAQSQVEANLRELYDAAAMDEADVTTRLRLAGYLQSLGLVEEGNAILKEVAGISGEVDLLTGDEGCDGCPRSIGADLIVGDINSTSNWGKVETSPGVWTYAFSNGRTACNIGSVTLDWIHNTNRHSVFGGTMFRIHEQQLRQIGQGWLKHSFFALSQNLCSGGSCQGTNGSYLGVDCSDPYTSGRTGSQGNLGPRSQIRVSSGYFPYPPTQPLPVSSVLTRRINVRLSDLNPANWPGAIYFTDAIYVQWQDAQDDNDNNNNSWRRVLIPYNNGGTPEDPADDVVGNLSFSGSTQRMRTPIDAWQFYVPSVETTDVIVPFDCNMQIDGTPGPTYWSGRFQAGANVVDNADGTWTYHYAVFNQNSDRSARSFRVAAPSTVQVTDIGFADVDYHSGEGEGGGVYDGTDWAIARNLNDVTWSTDSYETNVNANALRWSTVYNFWFTADAPPDLAGASLGLFRPGPDADPVFDLRGPACLLAWDLDGSGRVGFEDLNLVLSGFGGEFTFEDLNALLGQFSAACE